MIGNDVNYRLKEKISKEKDVEKKWDKNRLEGN